MAEPIKFRPPPAEVNGARDELEMLLSTLHKSGVLRTLTGLFGGLPAVTDVALEHVQSQGGKRLSGNLAVLATSLTRLEPHAVQRLVRGLVKGSERIVTNAAARPPGFFRLLRRMHSEDARRGLQAVTILLESIGQALATEPEVEATPDPALLPEGEKPKYPMTD